MIDPRITQLCDVVDDLSMAIRNAAACLRATHGAGDRDTAHLCDLALEALEKGETALDVSLAGKEQA